MFTETQIHPDSYREKINWLYHMTPKNNKYLHMKTIIAIILLGCSLAVTSCNKKDCNKPDDNQKHECSQTDDNSSSATK